jgi:hypothetical protein
MHTIVPLDICIIISHSIWQHSNMRLTLGLLYTQTTEERGSDVPTKHYDGPSYDWLSCVFSVRFDFRKNTILRTNQGHQISRVLSASPSLCHLSVITSQYNPKVTIVANQSAAHCSVTFHTLNLQSNHYTAPRV